MAPRLVAGGGDSGMVVKGHQPLQTAVAGKWRVVKRPAPASEA